MPSSLAALLRPARAALWTLLGLLALLPALAAAPESLAQDGRAGVVVDRQGLVRVRPAGRQRWSALAPRGLVMPGDRLRTEASGAHAVEVRLARGGRFTLGPASLLDVRPDGSLLLLEGDVEVLGSEAAPVAVGAAGGFAEQVRGTLWLRARGGAAERLPEAPRWLTGYRATGTDEWMGALLADVDGRQVPLHVGYHKVDVEIRDQVARVTVEQSFVNDTDARLEGTFRFPLPAAASVSGFGMWIGQEYVEADVVERERARQIYEDILRRQKDPGLLEWAGGNLFQARVFPIEPRSEKRVRLRYTEVLPLEGSTWRFRYALQSELLKAHPLRELSITVRAASTVPLAEVLCTSHADATVSSDAGTALVELSRRSFAPDRDFEVAARVRGTDGLTVVTHRRGADGWFMLLLAPPDGGAGAWQRDLVPEGAPLDLIVALDTSGSSAGRPRADALAFVRALLGQLGAADRVRVCAFDARLAWLRPEARPADPDTVDEALRFLEARRPMGWTDLEGALDPLLAAAGPGTQVVVVSDAIATSGDGDVQALARRIRARAAGTQAVVHAVAPAAAYEQPVLEALAALGGGSVRHLKDDPAEAAQRLLAEAAQPALKDLAVEVEGLATARVYPERLPNLPLGGQQVVLGRFQPPAPGAPAPAAGTVVVRGTLAGKPVTFRAPIVVPGDEQGNSFLPRLWARRHLDALLAQGSTPEVKAEIVRFSTTYGIMTPYTSLLVLESDEDRERYGVTRRVHARDGEVEFAAAGDAATLAARKEALKAAQGWRLALRRALLTEVARLDRDRPYPVPSVALAEEWLGWGDALATVGSGHSLPSSGPMDGSWEGASGGGGGGGGSYGRRRSGVVRKSAWDGFASDHEESDGDLRFEGPGGLPPPTAAPAALREAEEYLSEDKAEGGKPGAPQAGAPSEPYGGEASGDDALYEDVEAIEEELAEKAKDARGGLVALERSRRAAPRRPSPGRTDVPIAPRLLPEVPPDPVVLGLPAAGQRAWAREDALARGVDLPEPPPLVAEPALRAWLEALLRTPREGAPGALRVRALRRAVHGPSQALLAEAANDLLWSPQRWFLRTTAPLAEPVERALVDGRRSVLRTGQRLARTWEAGPAERWDLDALERALGLPALRDLSGCEVVEQGAEAPLTLLRATRAAGQAYEVWAVDRARGLVVERRRLGPAGELLARVRYLDHPGTGPLARWPRRLVSEDAQGRVVDERRLEVEALAPEALASGVERALAGREDVLAVDGALPTVSAARRALREGRAGFPERLSLLLERLQAQRWDEMWAHAEAALALVPGKPGAAWIRAGLLSVSRRPEALAALVPSTLEPLVRAGGEAQVGLMLALQGPAGVLSPAEQAALAARLRALLGERAEQPLVARWLQDQEIRLAYATGQAPRARELEQERARQRAWDVSLQLQRAHTAWNEGRPEDALALLGTLLADPARFTEEERERVFTQQSDWLLERQDLEALRPALVAWTEAAPRSVEAEQRLLAVLLALGEEAPAHARMDAALAAVPGPEAALDPAVRARAEAALRVALGDGWFWRAQRVEPRWPEALAALARRCLLGTGPRLALATTALRDGTVSRSDAGSALRRDLRAALAAPEAAAWPLPRLVTTVGLLGWGRADADLPPYQALLALLLARLEREALPADREQVLGALRAVAAQRPEGLESGLEGLRRLVALTGASPAQAAVQQRLLQALLESPWTAAREAEALGLLAALAAEPVHPAVVQGRHGLLLGRVVDWARAARTDAALGSAAERAARSREATRLAEREARRTARLALAEVLAQAPLSTGPGPSSALDPRAVTDLERAALLSEAGGDLPGALALAERVLGLLPVGGEPLDPQHPAAGVLAALERRAALLLTHVVTRRGATAALADRAAALLGAREASLRSDGRYELFRFLAVLDRVEALRARLAAWQAEPDADPRWTRAVAYLDAEAGRLEPAVAALLALRGTEGALTPGDHEVLSQWLLVTGDERARREVLTARYHLLNEWELQNRVQALTQSVRRAGPGVPGTLDPEALPMLGVLLAKSSYPANHLWVVLQLYQTTKDHRVLAALAEALPGQAPHAGYALLQQLAQVLGQVHEEAALDALRRAAEARRAGAEPRASRALDLLRAAVEARASEVLLQDPGPAQRGAALLAGVGAPQDAQELQALLGFLAQVRWGAATPLGGARLALLERLLAGADVASGDALRVAQVLARALFDAQRRDDGLARLEAACRAAAQVADPRARAALVAGHDALARLLAEAGRFVDAERLLETERTRAPDPAAARRLTYVLYDVYVQAADKNGTLSFGQGDDLLRGASARLEADWAARPTEGHDLHGRHVNLWRTARARRVAAASGAARAAFATERLPRLWGRFPQATSQHVAVEADALAALAGPREALRFLLAREQAEPPFYRRIGQDVWDRNHWDMARWRSEGMPLGDVERPLLALVVARIQEALRALDAPSHGFVNGRYQWSEQIPAFLAAARGVSEEAPASGALQAVCARLALTLDRPAEAADLLQAAEQRGVLDRAGRALLLHALTRAKRWEPALALAERLLAETPDELALHQQRVTLLAALGRADAARAALRASDAHFGTKPRPTALEAWGALGTTAAHEDVRLHAEAVDLLTRAIEGRQALAQGRARGLAGLREPLARSYAALGRTDEAIDTMGAVIVERAGSWRSYRPGVDDGLVRLLEQAQDLDAFAARFEQRVAQTRADVPVLRRALAHVYMSAARRNPALAIRHLEALRALYPGDTAVLDLLVQQYQAAGQPGPALERLEERLSASPWPADLWGALAQRYTEAQRPDDAERALTGAVEARPLEPEGHALLARARSAQGRHAQAAERWARVTAVRPLEPEARVLEAQAWIAAGQPQRARAPLDEVLAGTWEERHGDVKQRAAALRATLPRD